MPSSEVFSKYKAGTLRSGSKHGPPVKSHAQAIAIYLSEKRKEGQHGGKYPHKAVGGGLGGDPPGGPLADNAQRWQGFESRFPKDAPPRDWNMTPGVIGNRGMTGMGWPFMQQGLGQQFPGKFGLNPIQPGMRADGGNVIPFPPNLYTQRLKEMDTDAYNKMMTQRTLGRALGRDNVLPINPDDKARGGGLGYQFGGSPTSQGLTPGWIERQEARNISHTGPIISAVGGRTDNHAINVPSGSYVLPAAHVSAMGQGNTLNGMQILTRMFGAPMKLPRGSGPPSMRAPRAMGMSSSGGSRGDGNIGRPVPIMAAGGEFVLSPDQVAKVGGGDVNFGHTILDRWVKNTHKKYAKTIANLPPPAKT